MIVLGAITVLVLVALIIQTHNGSDNSHGSLASHGGHAQQDAHTRNPQQPNQTVRTRPENQVAVLTVWAEAEKLESTARFYENVLGLRRIGNGPDPYIFDTDGTFVVIMEGRLEQRRDPKRRWPMFALTVPDLDLSIKALRAAKMELPWGIEEFGTPSPSSRYVMFHDPAGNLIELVEWL